MRSRQTKKERDVDGLLRLSHEAHCLDETSVERLKKRTGQHVQRCIQTIEGLTMRTLCPVSFFGRRQLADVVTGSLYDVETGQCLTGDRRIVEGDARRIVRRRRGTSEAQEAAGWTNAKRRAA